jgi:hypothetical protein
MRAQVDDVMSVVPEMIIVRHVLEVETPPPPPDAVQVKPKLSIYISPFPNPVLLYPELTIRYLCEAVTVEVTVIISDPGDVQLFRSVLVVFAVSSSRKI